MTNSSFVIPLNALCNVFEIDTLPPKCAFTIELGVNQNALELFDYNATLTSETTQKATMRFIKAPEIHLNLVEQTASYQIAFEQLFNKYQNYRLWDGRSWDARSKELANGISETEILYQSNLYQYKWLELSLMDTDAVKHPNMFCNYDYNPIMQKIKKIKITGLLSNSTNKELVYDFTDCTDVDDLQKQYLARFQGFGNSRKSSEAYKNSRFISTAPCRETYMTATHSIPLWLDISDTRSYTEVPDPPNAVLIPNIKIVFKNTLDKVYLLRVLPVAV